jgi:hypothetical protein
LEYGATEPGSIKEDGDAVRDAPDQEPYLVGTIAVWGAAASLATEQPSDIPAWLQSHIGEGEGQIAQVVLQRTRSLYLKKVAAGVVKNPCYFAMVVRGEPEVVARHSQSPTRTYRRRSLSCSGSCLSGSRHSASHIMCCVRETAAEQ